MVDLAGPIIWPLFELIDYYILQTSMFKIEKQSHQIHNPTYPPHVKINKLEKKNSKLLVAI